MKTSTAINNCTETGSLLSADNSSLQAKKSMGRTPLQKKSMTQSVQYCRGLQSSQNKPATGPNMLQNKVLFRIWGHPRVGTETFYGIDARLLFGLQPGSGSSISARWEFADRYRPQACMGREIPARSSH